MKAAIRFRPLQVYTFSLILSIVNTTEGLGIGLKTKGLIATQETMNTSMTERAFWLAWSQISGVGPVLIRRLHQHCGSLEAAWQASYDQLFQVEGLGKTNLASVLKQRQSLNPQEFLEQHLQKNPQFWTPTDPEYPRLLLEIPNYPPVLYYQGQVDLAENSGQKPLIAIVGTRDATDYGKRWTRKISELLVNYGFTVISGMAQGIDTEAHWGCLEAGKRTIAVLGTGLNVIYPPRNRELYHAISKQGLVVSEYPADTQPNRLNFPQRNRIIAGWSRAVLVMEAPTSSGALITAHLANDFCRDVYVLPGRLDDPKSKGCLGLLSKGAQVIIHEQYLLECLGAIPQLDFPQEQAEQLSLFDAPPQFPELNLEPEVKLVLQVVPTEPISLDQIIQKSGLSSEKVLPALLQLELLGLVTQLPGMRYQR